MAEKTEKAKKQQLSNAKTEMRSRQNALSLAQNTLKDNNDKLSRLKTAKRQMESLEEEVQGKYSSYMSYFQNPTNYGGWMGNKCTSIQTELLNTVAGKYSSYLGCVSSLVAQINASIAAVEKENGDLNYYITSQIAQINQLMTQINILSGRSYS